MAVFRERKELLSRKSLTDWFRKHCTVENVVQRDSSGEVKSFWTTLPWEKLPVGGERATFSWTVQRITSFFCEEVWRVHIAVKCVPLLAAYRQPEHDLECWFLVCWWPELPGCRAEGELITVCEWIVNCDITGTGELPLWWFTIWCWKLTINSSLTSCRFY